MIIRKLVDAHEVCMPKTDASQRIRMLVPKKGIENYKSSIRQIFKNVNATFGGGERKEWKKKKKMMLARALIEVLLHITLSNFTYHLP